MTIGLPVFRHVAASLAAVLLANEMALAQDTPDLVLTNGKIVTVDEQFSIAEAVAVAGERILAVGDSKVIADMAGPDTRRVDLDGRTVIPGLIDNHNHIIRATEYWTNEVRLDGITSRQAAVAALEAKARALPEGGWLLSLGGWSEEQFRDDSRGFTLEELDRIASDRPAFLQVGYSHVYVNTAWLEAMDIPVTAESGTVAESGLARFVERSGAGRATGRLSGGFEMIGAAIRRFPPVSQESQIAGIEALMSDLNAMGLTTVYDAGGLGVREESYRRIAALAERGALTLRIPHTLWGGVIDTPEGAERFIESLKRERPFSGGVWFPRVAAGEILYAPFHWDTTTRPATPGADDTAIGERVLRAAAVNGWPVELHAIQPETITRVLDVVARVNAAHPVRALRWSICHADNIAPAQIARARDLGMTLRPRSIFAVGGKSAVFESFGEAAYNMPPLRQMERHGVLYGLGTDGTKAGQVNPFVTLWWAVTGKSLGGKTILRQTLSREDALIAHTRANAQLLFHGRQLGSIAPGRLADMVVLDRDYLECPDSEIRKIKPVLTMVGGKVVFRKK